MLLRRFADDQDRLIVRQRDGEAEIPMTVNRACREVGFYDIELDPSVQHLAPANQVEISLSDFEGRARPLLDRLVTGDLQLTDQNRFDLLLFVAFQAARGWRFREEVTDLVTLEARRHLEATMTVEDVQVWLRDQGQPSGVAAARRRRRHILESSWRVAPPPSALVQGMIGFALNILHPDLYFGRRIQVVRFDKPSLYLGDEPVVLWTEGDGPVGFGNADVIYMPIDRRHALALPRLGLEGLRTVDEGMATRVNGLVATSAHRWIFRHPDDPPVPNGIIDVRPAWAETTVDVRRQGEEVRVLKRIERRVPR